MGFQLRSNCPARKLDEAQKQATQLLQHADRLQRQNDSLTETRNLFSTRHTRLQILLDDLSAVTTDAHIRKHIDNMRQLLSADILNQAP